MGARMETDMRKDLFNHFQRLSFSYYDKKHTGEMMSRLVATSSISQNSPTTGRKIFLYPP
jgi:ABC-type bacteriocin/lantibiotic exporter with double-glycine peptidase domain